MKTLKQEKDEATLRHKHMSKRGRCSGRFFLLPEDFQELRRAEQIAFSIAKRNKEPIHGVIHHVWSCECCCVSAHPAKHGTAQLPPKQPKRQRQKADKSKYHPTAKSVFGKVLHD
jgi:hypothetical protein